MASHIARRRATPVRAAAVAVALLLAMPALAHTGDVVYPVYELPTYDLPNLHDGTLEDWETVLPFTTLTHNDFKASGTIDPADLAFRIFLAWHDQSQRIYMAMERIDDDYSPSAQGRSEPAFLYIDADHSGGRFDGFSTDIGQDEYRRATCAQSQRYAIWPEPTPPDARLSVCGFSRGWADKPPWADVGGFHQGEAPSTSVFEIAVTAWDDLNWLGPDDSIRSSLHAGNIVGLMIDIWDTDRDSDALKFHGLNRFSRFTSPLGNLSQDFVDAELVPCGVSDCSGAKRSTVSSSSWGRIKISLR